MTPRGRIPPIPSPRAAQPRRAVPVGKEPPCPGL